MMIGDGLAPCRHFLAQLDWRQDIDQGPPGGQVVTHLQCPACDEPHQQSTVGKLLKSLTRVEVKGGCLSSDTRMEAEAHRKRSR
jgi:hypothetical protein